MSNSRRSFVPAAGREDSHRTTQQELLQFGQPATVGPPVCCWLVLDGQSTNNRVQLCIVVIADPACLVGRPGHTVCGCAGTEITYRVPHVVTLLVLPVLIEIRAEQRPQFIAVGAAVVFVSLMASELAFVIGGGRGRDPQGQESAPERRNFSNSISHSRYVHLSAGGKYSSPS